MMEWTIKVKPLSDELTAWIWTAERADGETTTFSKAPSPSLEDALNEARYEVRAVERSLSRISEASIAEIYLPTAEELLVAE